MVKHERGEVWSTCGDISDGIDAGWPLGGAFRGWGWGKVFEARVEAGVGAARVVEDRQGGEEQEAILPRPLVHLVGGGVGAGGASE